MTETGRARGSEAAPADPMVVRGTDAHWYACFTRSRHEKRVAAALSERGIEAFLPLLPRVQQWKDRKKLVHFPLFPGYVFGRFPLRELHAVLTIPGLATIVRTGGVPTPIPDGEIENVRCFAEVLAGSGIPAEAASYVVEGDRVRITTGPFRGVEGVVVERRGRRRVLVGLEAIGQGLEVDVDAESLLPLGAAGG